MATITSTPSAPGTNRSFTYTVGNIVFEMALVHMSYTVTNQMIARQPLYRVYRFFLSFYLCGSSVQDHLGRLDYAERVLTTRGGTLKIVETSGGSSHTLFECKPAVTPPQVMGGGGAVGSSIIRNAVLQDIAWGPTPVHFHKDDLPPLGGRVEWVVEVVTIAEDALRLAPNTWAVGVDAAISYSIDNNHYTTRTAVGKIYLASTGRANPSFWWRHIQSLPDFDVIRTSLVSAANSALRPWMDPIRVPSGFERIKFELSVDETETTLNYVIVDRERFRMLPPLMTEGACVIRTAIGAVTAMTVPIHIQKTVSGYYEAPSDVPTMQVVRACVETIDKALNYTGREPIYVADYSLETDVYRNRVTFAVGAILIKFPGEIDPEDLLGIRRYDEAPALPPMEGGTANLRGTGYRLESQGGGGLWRGSVSGGRGYGDAPARSGAAKSNAADPGRPAPKGWKWQRSNGDWTLVPIDERPPVVSKSAIVKVEERTGKSTVPTTQRTQTPSASSQPADGGHIEIELHDPMIHLVVGMYEVELMDFARPGGQRGVTSADSLQAWMVRTGLKAWSTIGTFGKASVTTTNLGTSAVGGAVLTQYKIYADLVLSKEVTAAIYKETNDPATVIQGFVNSCNGKAEDIPQAVLRGIAGLVAQANKLPKR